MTKESKWKSSGDYKATGGAGMHLVVSSRDADTSTFFFYLYHCVDAGEASTIWSSSACKYVLKAGSSSMRLMSPSTSPK